VLILTGHRELAATIAGLAKYPSFRGKFHFVRRAIKPRWLDALVTRRFNQAGFGAIGKRGSLDRLRPPTAETSSSSCSTSTPRRQTGSKSISSSVRPGRSEPRIIALATGAPVLPAAGWRRTSEATSRFGEPIAPVSRGHERSDRARRAPSTPRSSALPGAARAMVLGASALEGLRVNRGSAGFTDVAAPASRRGSRECNRA
jgi:hypothetical protein